MKRGRKYEIMTGSSVSEAMKLTNIQIASSPPMTALNRMLEKVHSAVLPTMATAVKLTAFPDEIGRASCRERVETSEVAVAMKKKTKRYPRSRGTEYRHQPHS